MSTLQKNIQTIQSKLSKLKKDSRSYTLYISRLIKKIEQYKRYINIRAHTKSLYIKNALKNNVDIDIHGIKFTTAFK